LLEPAALAGQGLVVWDGESLDGLDVSADGMDAPCPELLRHASRRHIDHCLVSDLLRSRCPVTGQPDWASVQIRYHGVEWDRPSVLRYLLSYRRHAEFHEHCVERLFHDLWQRLAPDRLSVYARYTRRGGIDINPFRSSEAGLRIENPRLVRQ
jgi:7-cyano-7-deazaguanine reductase